jgi:hypothetical protein
MGQFGVCLLRKWVALSSNPRTTKKGGGESQRELFSNCFVERFSKVILLKINPLTPPYSKGLNSLNCFNSTSLRRGTKQFHTGLARIWGRGHAEGELILVSPAMTDSYVGHQKSKQIARMRQVQFMKRAL